jgi:hypothetical protein
MHSGRDLSVHPLSTKRLTTQRLYFALVLTILMLLGTISLGALIGQAQPFTGEEVSRNLGQELGCEVDLTSHSSQRHNTAVSC